MLIEHTEVYGFQAAIRGMRNSRKSWNKSDSRFGVEGAQVWIGMKPDTQPSWPWTVTCPETPWIGPNDTKLCKQLSKAGSEHRKFLRAIQIWVDLTLPRYIWTEFDTYKVATVRLSESSMDNISKRPLTVDDFEDQVVLPQTLEILNGLGSAHRSRGEYVMKSGTLTGFNLVRAMKGILPESFLQKSTINLNYETAITIHRQRHNHRLRQWRADNPNSICSWISSLPYMKLFLQLDK